MSQGVLVTGGTGFIGSHLVRQLLAKAEKVIVSNVSGKYRQLADLRNQVKITRADLRCFTDVLRLIETNRPRTIYHVGAMLAPACDDNPEAGIQTNALGTYHILEAARLFGVRQVIFASSMSIFSGAYVREPALNDFSVTRPDFIYGAAKLFSENIGLFFKKRYDLDYRGLRLPNVIGPGTQTHGYLEYINKAIEESAKGHPYSVYVEPHIRVPILSVQDAVRAFIELAQAPLAQIKTVNYIVLGPTPPPTAEELVRTVSAKIPESRLGFQIDKKISNLIEAVTAHGYEDTFARQEWGWRYRYGVDAMVNDFLARMEPQLFPRVRQITQEVGCV